MVAINGILMGVYAVVNVAMDPTVNYFIKLNSDKS